MCRGKAWPEQATTQAPGDRSRGWARTVLMINPPASRVADVHSIGVPERWQLRLRASITFRVVVLRPLVGQVPQRLVELRGWRGRGWIVARAEARVDDLGRMPRLGRGVHPREVQVVSAPVVRITVP